MFCVQEWSHDQINDMHYFLEKSELPVVSLGESFYQRHSPSKNESPVIIYSPSCRFNPVWLTLFCQYESKWFGHQHSSKYLLLSYTKESHVVFFFMYIVYTNVTTDNQIKHHNVQEHFHTYFIPNLCFIWSWRETSVCVFVNEWGVRMQWGFTPL